MPENKKTFDPIWDQIHSEVEWGNYPSEDVVRFVARNFYAMDRPKVRLLDIGCGSGTVSWYLTREGFIANGCDGSRNALKKAMKRFAAESMSGRFLETDAGALPYKTASFDGIIDSAAINANTVAGIRKILAECFRVLKPGGRIFSTGLFKIGMTGYGTGEKLEEHTFREITEGSLAHRGTIHFFDPDQIRVFWQGAGFTAPVIDEHFRTDRGGETTIGYYLAQAQKP